MGFRTIRERGKYPQPAYDFDYWAIAQMERGNFEPLEKLSSEQLDEVGNTEMLPWYFLFGALGNTPGELLTYQPTWKTLADAGDAVPAQQAQRRFRPRARSRRNTFSNRAASSFTRPGKSSGLAI